MAHIEDVEVSSYHFGNGKLFVKRENVSQLMVVCRGLQQELKLKHREAWC